MAWCRSFSLHTRPPWFFSGPWKYVGEYQLHPKYCRSRWVVSSMKNVQWSDSLISFFWMIRNWFLDWRSVRGNMQKSFGIHDESKLKDHLLPCKRSCRQWLCMSLIWSFWDLSTSHALDFWTHPRNEATLSATRQITKTEIPSQDEDWFSAMTKYNREVCWRFSLQCWSKANKLLPRTLCLWRHRPHRWSK